MTKSRAKYVLSGMWPEVKYVLIWLSILHLAMLVGAF